MRVRVRASGINFADLLARVGLYPDAPKPPCVVGYEVSGIADQIGEGVRGNALGDRVMAMPKFGGYWDTVVVPAQQVFRMPPQMTFEEGAALPVVYVTAHTMMVLSGNLRPDPTCSSTPRPAPRASPPSIWPRPAAANLGRRIGIEARFPAREGRPPSLRREGDYAAQAPPSSVTKAST